MPGGNGKRKKGYAENYQKKQKKDGEFQDQEDSDSDNSIISGVLSSDLESDKDFSTQSMENRVTPTLQKNLNVQIPENNSSEIETTKLYLQAQEEEIKLSKKNPITIRDALHKISKSAIQGVQFLENGNLIVLCETNQIEKFLSTTSLDMDSTRIGVAFSIARNEKIFQAKIFSYNLKDVSPELIQAELANQNVTKVEKLLKDPTKSDVPLFLLTFSTKDIPTYVYVAYCRIKVEDYIPNPFRCTNCCRYGHTKTYCRSQKPICGKCSVKGHFTENCKSEVIKCPNCDGKHEAFHKKCPKTIQEKEIHRIKHENGIGYFEAKEIYISELKQSFQFQNDSHFPSLPNQKKQASFPTKKNSPITVWSSSRKPINLEPTDPSQQSLPSLPSQQSPSQFSMPTNSDNTIENSQQFVLSQNGSNFRQSSGNKNICDHTCKSNSKNESHKIYSIMIPLLIKILFSESSEEKAGYLKELGESLQIKDQIKHAVASHQTLSNLLSQYE